MNKKMILIAVFCMFLIWILVGCSDPMDIRVDQIKKADWLEEVHTDKAIYSPDDSVGFTVSFSKTPNNSQLIIRYKHLNQTVGTTHIEVKANQMTWQWQVPDKDHQGYLAEIFLEKDGEVADHINVAIDVSSDWAVFPRYGYLADFHTMNRDEMEKVIKRLNRLHINGIQFYDWQYKHHQPLKWENDAPAKIWKDIANRPVSLDTVKTYIGLAHQRNMKAMNYNLLFGAYDDAHNEGVKESWGLFKDPLQQSQDKHDLPNHWASDIYIMDPSNEQWQEYIISKEKDTFRVLPFDGWHVDQLGDRGLLWDDKGDTVNLILSYPEFLQKAKEQLSVDYVMNAVGQFGQSVIAAQAPVEFLYTEVWDQHPTYGHLKEIIDENRRYSKGRLNTVLAAYINYQLSNMPGVFNTAGVLFTDAVIFASGGSHIEMGENMLSKEYFPHKNLSLSNELEQQLIYYYDFLVAYENLLRGSVQENDITNVTSNYPISFQVETGKIWTFSKQQANRDILHLINFADATTLHWSDTNGIQAEPSIREDVKLKLPVEQEVEQVWFATPDFYGGSPVFIDFTQSQKEIEFTIPQLKYWDMVVIEYK